MEVFDPRQASDGDLEALAALDRAVAAAESWHHSLDPPVAHRVLELRHPPASIHRRVWVHEAEGTLAGYATIEWNDRTDNRDHVALSVAVHPDVRRAGIGTRLLTAAVEDAVDRFDARLVDIDAPLEGSSARFLTAYGVPARYVDRRNVCESLDRSTLETWLAAAPAGYSLVSWDGPCSPDLVEAFCDLHAVMDTAPTEDLEYDDEEHSPRRLADDERSWAEQECDWWTTAAHDGERLVGFTTIVFPRRWRGHAEQEDTGVRPEHRGRGIARWLKAVSALRVLAERPDVQWIATWNADSNGPMNRLNEAMGFACATRWAGWQAEASRILRAAAR